jgi:hypothetical protein
MRTRSSATSGTSCSGTSRAAFNCVPWVLPRSRRHQRPSTTASRACWRDTAMSISWISFSGARPMRYSPASNGPTWARGGPDSMLSDSAVGIVAPTLSRVAP